MVARPDLYAPPRERAAGHRPRVTQGSAARRTLFHFAREGEAAVQCTCKSLTAAIYPRKGRGATRIPLSPTRGLSLLAYMQAAHICAVTQPDRARLQARAPALASSGLELSEIGYGAWGIGGSQWGGADDDESIQALHRAIDLGVNFIDTALAYGDGRSERLVGRVVRERPETVFVATKVPPKNRIWPAPDGLPVENVFPGAYEPRPGYRFNFAARL